MLINEVDVTFKAGDKLNKLLTFAECFRDMSNAFVGIPESVMPYDGFTLRISDLAYHHKHSVLILPNNPSQAVACLFDEKPRLLFAEYDEKNSAETIIKKLYGTDGAYAHHYSSFMDCKSRYPNQKHLLRQSQPG